MKTLINSNFVSEWLGKPMNKSIILKEKPFNEAEKRFIVYNEVNDRIGEYDNLKQFSMVLKSEERRFKASNLPIQKELGVWMNKINKEVGKLVS